LDIGCGTGKSFTSMLDRGWQVTACDISPSMLELARQKAGGEAELRVADMRELPRFGEFDLVWALDDAVNYLLSEDELADALAGMRANLADTGLILFDVNTLHAYRTFFAETDVIERDGHRLVWRGLTDAETPAGSICESRLEIDPGQENEAVSVHRQRHFAEAEVLALLERAGLKCLGVYGHGYDGILKQPLNEAVHTKAIYIAGVATE
jgi:SAM-dependent methyltransferase